MRSALIILNALLVLIVVAIATSTNMDTPRVADALFGFIGGCLWGLAPTFTLLALRRGAGGGAQRVAYLANSLAVLGALLLAFVAPQHAWPWILGTSLFWGPYLLNMYGLRRVNQSGTAASNRPERPIPATPDAAVTTLALEVVPDTCVPVKAPPDAAESAIPATASRCSESTAEDLDERPVVINATFAPTLVSTTDSYFLRHWRGEVSLPAAYWINGVGLSLLLGATVTLLPSAAEGVSLRGGALLAIAVIFALVAHSFWAVVGIWRASRRHPEFGGSWRWAVTARCIVVIGVLSSINVLTDNLLPQLNEYVLIASGHDPVGRIEATFSGDGRTLVLEGMLGEGSAEKVTELLQAAPGVKTLMLASGGGRLREAEQIAALVSARAIDTYVEDHCESACTFIFLAGRDRAATPNAQIGFHRPSFPGIDLAAEARLARGMMADYRRAGMSSAFVDQVASTPADDMWYPSYKELLAEGVLTRVSLGNEAARPSLLPRRTTELRRLLVNDPLYIAYERHFPGIIDQATEAAMHILSAGGTDTDAWMAARNATAEHRPVLIAAASPAQLRDLVEIVLDQLTAAQAISDEACRRLLGGKLNVHMVLPPDLVQRETAWVVEVLEGSLTPRLPLSEAEVDLAITPLAETVPLGNLLVLADWDDYANEPGAQCDSTRSLYQEMLNLPEPGQSLALRAMLQSE